MVVYVIYKLMRIDSQYTKNFTSKATYDDLALKNCTTL
jgi:hypothetical protein